MNSELCAQLDQLLAVLLKRSCARDHHSRLPHDGTEDLLIADEIRHFDGWQGRLLHSLANVLKDLFGLGLVTCAAIMQDQGQCQNTGSTAPQNDCGEERTSRPT